MSKLLEANEICAPFLKGDVSKKILGNYVLFRLKQELKRPDTEEFGALLLEFIEADLASSPAPQTKEPE